MSSRGVDITALVRGGCSGFSDVLSHLCIMRCKQDSSCQELAQVLGQKRLQGCRAAAQVGQAHA